MRLFKKAAVCLLAAAMAVSMLTACGGDAGGGSAPANPGNGGGNGSGSTVVTPEQPETPGKDDTDNSGASNPSIPENPASVTWETSLTKKYYQGVSKTNFHISGVDNSGALLAYAVQGSNQLMVEQVEGGFLFVYTTGNNDLYINYTTSIPSGSVGSMVGWKTLEAYGKEYNATDAQISETKQELLTEMSDWKEAFWVADKVKQNSFTAQIVADTANQKFYAENLTNITIDSTSHTYQFLYALEDSKIGDINYKAGDLVCFTTLNSESSYERFYPLSKLEAASSSDFPNVNN